MNESFKKFLFTKHILVSDYDVSPENNFEALFSLANILNIKITKGQELANLNIFKYASSQLGKIVPQPFYLGFPQSVRNLSPDQLLFDQLLHYTITYGLGNFSEAGHSLLEENFERIAFKEKTNIKEFVILNEKEAELELQNIINNLLLSSRPLNDVQYLIVKKYFETYNFTLEQCNCKDTVINLLLDTKKLNFVNLLHLSDIIKVVEVINYKNYGNKNIKKLNLKNQDRKFITKILDIALNNNFSVIDCFEKQAIWCGILHHIHYKPKTEKAIDFVNSMRNGKNISAYSKFEKAMNDGNIKLAVDTLLKFKGTSSIIRNLNYIVSRCKNEEDLEVVLNVIQSKNNIILIQNLISYSNYKTTESRKFAFTKFNTLKIHQETKKEMERRKSIISKEHCNMICNILNKNLEANLKGKLGKVYIDENMKNIALPIQENTSMGGFGTLPKGSRIDIEDAKKIRAFVYWEKVNDIDLSAIGLTNTLQQREFSWRTMSSNQSKGITFSGDITSGYFGASEYFDIDLAHFVKKHPDIKYLILNANVFSGTPFNNCICKAGFMKRDVIDSGEIFEPKTVETSFQINCDSTFAYMFAVDIEKKQIIWLNIARNSNSIIAGTNSFGALLDYFNFCDVINMEKFFSMLATEVVTNIGEADVIVSDKNIEVKENVETIRSWDTDKILALLNS